MPAKAQFDLKTYLFIFPILFFLIILTFLYPPRIQAHPSLGITPTPTPTAPAPTPPPPDSDPPPEEIEVQLGCRLTCSTAAQPLVTQAEVQLIHLGSGWIAEGSISSEDSTRFEVPYPGEWEVYLMSEPQLAALDEMTAVGPVPQLLGTVSANSGLQYVACPVTCVDISEPPLDLPATGDNPFARPFHPPLLVMVNILLLVVVVIFSANRCITLRKSK